MQIFLDTAVLDEIRQAAEWGVLDGVTTNPTLAARAGRAFKENILAISEIIGDRGTVSAETVSTDVEGMIEEARLVTSWAPNIVAKIPCTPNGLAATRKLAEEGIRVNMTLVFNATQGLLAMKAGAYYVSPFIGRLDDAGQNGMELIEQLVHIKHTYGFETQVLAASIRHPMHVVQAAMLGADIATMPFKVLQQIMKHPLTDIGLQRFLEDWASIPEEMRPF
ncbi:transaldolase [Ardenticatena maritima]|uniref:Probable transaldolase n=1 Tax=Ardenticatena maritima TaxID=872965 RepID=A0A0M9UBN8_9CHLR|nr:fructose-6-phosphate aldolase [Ardenticatena maritima]KPL87781.1 transaldolase [Ardenticatena maritima]GAP62038.1 transaldolase [Ardenticatena maritima]